MYSCINQRVLHQRVSNQRNAASASIATVLHCSRDTHRRAPLFLTTKSFEHSFFAFFLYSFTSSFTSFPSFFLPSFLTPLHSPHSFLPYFLLRYVHIPFFYAFFVYFLISFFPTSSVNSFPISFTTEPSI